MRSAIRITATLLGMYTAILAAGHGLFELRQGNVRIEQIAIHAIGAPCEPGTVWHDCLPALSILPTFTITGTATLLISAAVLAWAGFFSWQQRGGWILLALALALLLVGGGFVAMFVGVVASLLAIQIHQPLPLPRVLAALWPGTLIAYIVWIIAQWTFGTLVNDLLLQFAGAAFLLDLMLLVLTGLSAVAHDFRQKRGAEVAVSM